MKKLAHSLTHKKKKMAAVCSATCNPDGKWSSPNPQCLAPCIIPEVEHGRPSERVGDKVRKPQFAPSTVTHLSRVSLIWRSDLVTWYACTDKKENQIFLIYKEFQNGAVAKSYITNGLLIQYMGKHLSISSYIRKPFFR
jgi:hypothetical protein